ncbi:MAG TPA: type IX secretion system membrane protein PorP/SprF, partial [Bacteroidales bacterium]|nr:type IX secretion system membrane protein PorP/SprF [Bacteroidales bacterium]
RLNNTFLIDAGGSFIFANVLWFGGSYRHTNEFIITAEYQVNEQIRLGGAYDLSIGELAGQTKGSMELILRYDFKYRIRAVSPRYF